MYCTLPNGPASIPADDARAALRRFAREARTLGTIARSIDDLGRDAAAAYAAALKDPQRDAWAALVDRTARLVDGVRRLGPILALDARETAACEFFASIVRENADLLNADDRLRFATR